MDLYTLTLKGIIALLESIDKKSYIPVVEVCIEKWENEKDTDLFRREFDKDGRFGDFRIDSRTTDTPQKGFWAAQMFSALVALSAQLADFRKKGISDDIEFIRKNFGAANEVMVTGKCRKCGYRVATASDIDKYVSKIVIAKRLVSGLEKGNIGEEVKAVVSLECDDIERERRKTILRLDNSGVEHSDKFGKLVICPECGSREIVEGRLLRSLRENVFVTLDR